MTPTAWLMSDLIHEYHTARVELYSGSRTVYGYDQKPRLKHYYRDRICADVISFYEFCFPEGGHNS